MGPCVATWRRWRPEHSLTTPSFAISHHPPPLVSASVLCSAQAPVSYNVTLSRLSQLAASDITALGAASVNVTLTGTLGSTPSFPAAAQQLLAAAGITAPPRLDVGDILQARREKPMRYRVDAMLWCVSA